MLKLTDLAARVERVEQSAARRIGELAASCAEALAQVAGLREEAGTLGGRADGIEHKLAEVSALLARMSAQIDDLTAAPEPDDQPGAAYRVNPGPPWWNPGDDRCADATERLRDWVDEVYRPVFGYLGAMLPGCWDRHPLCLACLDVLHEAWCLLYLPPRDPKMVFAQLDWLTRPLLQAAEVMAAETRPCRERGHREPGQPAAARGPGLAQRPPLTPLAHHHPSGTSNLMQITFTRLYRRGAVPMETDARTSPRYRSTRDRRGSPPRPTWTRPPPPPPLRSPTPRPPCTTS